MYSKQLLRRIISILFLTVVGGYLVPALSADNVQFSAKPDKCISLNKGQTCYQRVQIRWEIQKLADIHKLICLWREGDKVALSCWNGKSEGKHRYSLEASNTTRFYLVAGDEQEPVLARTAVKVAWVYDNRSSGRTRWRLF